ncbi:hypothetical protein KDK88_05890 [bacterium]|nr:hypothetical protein [bacterium]
MSLKLPTAVDVTRILEMCIGTNPVLKQVEEPFNLASPPAGTYVSWLKDDTNEVRGAILASLPAVAFLGGSMIMVPVGGQEDQVKAGAASEAIVDSMAEINNMLRGLFNRLQENVHVSPAPMVLFKAPGADDPNAWVLSPGERVDMAGSFPYGKGQLTILSRAE